MSDQLYIGVLEARTLLPADSTGWSDPYCVVSIGTQKFKKIHKTQYVKRTLNPQWNDIFIYNYKSSKDGYRSTLKFEVYDHDALTLKDLLGYVEIPLAPFSNHKWVSQWHKLKKLDKEGNHLRCRGYLHLQIQCVQPNQMSFLPSDCIDTTNINDTRSDFLQRQQEKESQVTSLAHENEDQRLEQQRKQSEYHNMVRMNSHNESTTAQDLVDPPVNPQYDNVGQSHPKYYQQFDEPLNP